MKLISATPSPWARKVRILLLEKGLDIEVVNDIPWSPQTTVPQFNPLEKLPILVTDSGESIYESRLIVEWIELTYPDPPMIPRDKNGYILAKKFEVLADGVLDAMLLYMFARRQEPLDQEWSDRQERKIHGGVAEVARLIGEREFAVGDSFGLADAAVGAMLGSLAFARESFVLPPPQSDWQSNFPDLARYFEPLSHRLSFIATAPVMFDYNPLETAEQQAA